jgi:gluconolactonase
VVANGKSQSEKEVTLETVLDIEAAKVFYDGLLTEPRLDHPEGLAIQRDGSIWCGGELGQIYRIMPDGSSIEQIASSDGFSQGMAFDKEDNLYFCDLKHAAVMKLDTQGDSLISRIPIDDNAAAGRREEVVSLPGVLPDGLAFNTEDDLYVACYEPSLVLRISPDGAVARLIGDEEAHLFCHPTNLAFRGSSLFTTNLGRWHITAIDTEAEGLPLYGGYSNER